MQQDNKTALKIWAIVWTAIFVLSAFAFLLAQIVAILNSDLAIIIVLIVLIFAASYYITLMLVKWKS